MPRLTNRQCSARYECELTYRAFGARSSKRTFGRGRASGQRQLSVACADLLEQTVQRNQLVTVQMSDLRAMKAHDRVQKLVDEIESRARDMDSHDASILVRTLAGYESAPFHAIDESRHIGDARHHPRADLETRKSGFTSATKYAEHVVLLLRDSVRPEELCHLERYLVCRSDDVQERGDFGCDRFGLDLIGECLLMHRVTPGKVLRRNQGYRLSGRRAPFPRLSIA